MARIGFGNWSLRTAGKGDARRSAYQPSDYTVTRRQRSRYTIRLWSVRHARFLEKLYARFADIFLRLDYRKVTLSPKLVMSRLMRLTRM